MRKYLLVLVALPVLVVVAEAGGGYDDVVVLVNTASDVSVSVGEYFQAARNIPVENILRVTAPLSETITGAEFESLRGQIEEMLTGLGMAERINYIVTTKGMPLRVDRGGVGSTSSASASVESELTCILGDYVGQIGAGSAFVSPYFNKNTRFSHKMYGIYLVTRLDGYSLEDVKHLIDRSGPGVPSSTIDPFVLDQDPEWPSQYTSLNTNIEKASSLLSSKGKTVLLNSDTTFLTRKSNIAGYVSWGSNDHHAGDFTENAIPHHTWAPGAIAETYVSTSGRSFENPPFYGQSLIADLIHEGASGAKGYVYEPFASAMADVSLLFNKYTSGYNLAESYYIASRYLSWMDVVIGDPKTSIVDPNEVLPIELASFEAGLSPDPASVQLTWTTASEVSNYGFMVQRRTTGTGEFTDIPGSFQHGGGTTISPRFYSWTDIPPAPGTYEYRLEQIDLDGTTSFSDSRTVTVAASLTGVEESRLPLTTGLNQNYPNPFNPSTTITYQLERPGRVTLEVYSTLGQRIAMLVDAQQDAGRHAVTWNAAEAAAGTYFARLRAEGREWITRMVSLK
ncbi:MAG: TIGR03790 family protein [Bacteroidota bacterium]